MRFFLWSISSFLCGIILFYFFLLLLYSCSLALRMYLRFFGGLVNQIMLIQKSGKNLFRCQQTHTIDCIIANIYMLHELRTKSNSKERGYKKKKRNQREKEKAKKRVKSIPSIYFRTLLFDCIYPYSGPLSNRSRFLSQFIMYCWRECSTVCTNIVQWWQLFSVLSYFGKHFSLTISMWIVDCGSILGNSHA